jgi:DNA-binding NarL/FixJ family response regulator
MVASGSFTEKGEDHHRSVFTNEEIKQILEMRQFGKTAKHIAQTMNKKHSTVKSLLYRNRSV